MALMTSLSAFAADIDLFFKGGVSVSKFNHVDSESKLGVAAGFGSKFLISDSRFFVMPEAMYVQKGHDSEVELSNGDILISGLFHMIEVPVIFGGQFDLPVSGMYLGVGVGPYVAYDFRFNEKSEDMRMVRRSENVMKKVSHGDVGVSATFEVHYKRLMVFFDYDLGLRDITQRTLGIDQAINHRNMRIGAGYTFPTMSISKQRKKPQM